MMLGAFAGGVTKGYESGKNIQQNQQRMDIMQQESDRAQRKSDFEQTQNERTLRIQQRTGDLAKKIFGDDNATDGSTQPTSALPAQGTSPVDSSGAVVANDTNPPQSQAPSTAGQGTPDSGAAQSAIPPQAVPPSTSVAKPVDTTTAAPPPNAAPAASSQASAPSAMAGGMAAAPAPKQGIDLTAPDFGTQSKFAKYLTGSFAIKAQEGALAPEELQNYQKFMVESQRNGNAMAFEALLRGDKTALDQIAAKNGVQSYQIGLAKGPDGQPHQVMTIIGKDGTQQQMPLTVMAAAFGATGVGAAAEKEDDDVTKQALTAAQANYYNKHGDATLLSAQGADKRGDAAMKRADMLANKAQPGPSYDPKFAQEELSKSPFTVPPEVSGMTPDKMIKDTFANNTTAKLANAAMSKLDTDGKPVDPNEALSTARDVMQKVNQAVLSQKDDKGMPVRFKSQSQFDAARAEFMEKNGLNPKTMPAATAATKPTSALPPRGQKGSTQPRAAIPMNTEPGTKPGLGRDSDRRQILSQEMNDENDAVAKATDPVEKARHQSNISALQRELKNLRG